MRTFLSAVTLIGAIGLSPVSQGIEFEFYKLTSSHAPNPGDELYPNQPGPTAVSNDWVGNPNLSYTVDGLTVTASGTYNGNPAIAMQDREKPWSDTRGAGLGVYKPYTTLDTSDDNIDLGEVLKLVFDREVTILELILRADKHNADNWSPGAFFYFNGDMTFFPVGTGSLAGSWTGTEFTFAHSGGLSDPEGGGPSHDFYVAALVVEPTEVPDVGSTFALFGFAILALVGLRRRGGIRQS